MLGQGIHLATSTGSHDSDQMRLLKQTRDALKHHLAVGELQPQAVKDNGDGVGHRAKALEARALQLSVVQSARAGERQTADERLQDVLHHCQLLGLKEDALRPAIHTGVSRSLSTP